MTDAEKRDLLGLGDSDVEYVASRMDKEWSRYCRMRLQTFVDDLRFKDSRRAWGWTNEQLTCAVILPEHVVDQWHVPFTDPELITKARYLIRCAHPDGDRVCESDPRAVLVLCPIY